MAASMAIQEGLPGRLRDDGYDLPAGLPFERWCHDSKGECGKIARKPRRGLHSCQGEHHETGRSHAMPSNDISPSVMAAVQSVARQLQATPFSRPKTGSKPHRPSVRRGAVRAADDLPWLAVPSLYFMQCTVCGLVKIGVSGDYRLRRIELERITGHRLRVLGFGYGDMEIESVVLGYFSPSRITGEWFSPSDEILEYARNLQYHPEDDQP